MTTEREALEKCVEALHGVIRVADRATEEFDAARAALADAESILALPNPDEDGWIKWEGGECPVAADAIVEVKLSCEEGGWNWESDPHPAWAWWWGWNEGKNTDIIAYRIVKG